ncbi:BspA family leucine-rich repeat surface protein [Turicibacter sp. TS3]|nr:BspA family leucine-rich repeat surface protein [Turicibacter sp. TS3]
MDGREVPRKRKSIFQGGYNGRQISLKDLKIFPSSMTHLQLEEVNGKKVQLETVDLLDSFKENRTVINLDLSGLDTSRVTNMSAMFSWCSYLKSLNVNGWNTENVQSMFEIFNYCSSLSNLDVSGFQTENVTKMGSMFSRCIQLKIIDFSQCHWVSVPNNVFNFSSTAPLIVISPSQGIKGYNFSSIRPLSWATFKANDGVFSDGSKEKSMQVNQYVYESREALETVGSSQNPACPTRCFLEWRSDVSLSDLPLEELVGQSYHAVWWPYSSRGRTQHHR